MIWRAEISEVGFRVRAADGLYEEEFGGGGCVFGGGVSPGDGGVRVVCETVAVLTGRQVSICVFLFAFVTICGAVERTSGIIRSDFICALQTSALFFIVVVRSK